MQIHAKIPLCFLLCLATAIIGCRKSEPNSMKANLPDWKRDHYQHSEGRALICYMVYGEFTNDQTISRSKYRTAGLPQGFELHKLDRKQHESLPFTDAEFGKGLEDKELFEQ